MKTRVGSLFRCWLFAGILLALLLVAVPTRAATRVLRPIVSDGGRISQSYLYGDVPLIQGLPEWHRGVDLIYGLGTRVYAIAEGTVVQYRESWGNNDHTDPYGWGNYVLIRHSIRHFDRTKQTSGEAYVYSIYAHLAYNSVQVQVGQMVRAGDWIAEVDNTGNSEGNHLHLQICIHPQSDRTLVPDTLDSENTSRNPELWLQPFNYGGTNTGTVIGRLTGTNGYPIGDKYIFGLQKPAGSGGSTYQRSRTYAYASANGDDIMVENWGTTDVLPGTYHLLAKNGDGTIYEDLGSYTVRAGETTYVGLDPFFLPDTLGNNAGWNSAIAVRNNSDSKTEVITTTFFNLSSSGVYGQRTDSVVPQGAITITLPGTPSWYTGPAIVAASGHVSSAMVLNDKGTQTYAYNGIPGQASVSGVGVGTAGFVPSYFSNYYNWWSDLYVQNAGITDTTVYVSFFNNAGTLQGAPPLPQTRTLGSYRRHIFSTQGGYATTGSIWITSTQPVAVVVRHWRDDIMAYEGFSSGKDVGCLPSLFKNYAYRWMSAYEVQEVAETTTTPWVTYYHPGGSNSRQLSTLSPRGHLEVYMQSETLPIPSRVSAKVWAESNKRMVMAIHHNDTLGIGALGYTVPQTGTRELFMPIVMKGIGGWDASLTVQNVGTTPVHVQVWFRNFDGSYCGYVLITSLPVGESKELHSELPSGLSCSAWVHSSSQPIVAAVHHAKAAGGPAWGYSAP